MKIMMFEHEKISTQSNTLASISISVVESKPCERVCVSKLGGALNVDVNDDATHNGQFSLQQNKINCKIW